MQTDRGDLQPLGQPARPSLARTMGLWTLTIYGVGDMLGSGIYALIGKAAGVMGNAVWLGFLASMVAALLTGLSYACLGSRYPRAAGAAYITHRAFHRPFLSYLIGLAVMASGLTSMATAARAFAGYLPPVLDYISRILDFAGPLSRVHPAVLIVGFILALTWVNYRGIRESTWVNLLCTVIEVGGLLFIVAVGLKFWGRADYLEGPAGAVPGARLVLQGAVLTFFSFVGFEDLLNVSEEVRDPRRTLPRALLLAMLIVTGVYLAVSVTAISVVPHRTLAASSGPLVEVVRVAATWFPPALFSAISLFAIANTALLNYIMGSRLVYGMAQQGLLPAVLGRVHPKRRTPHLAILALMVIVLVLALSGDISALAKATSVLLLGVFVVVNSALLVLKRRPDEPRGAFEVPAVVPLLGAATALLLLVHAQAREVLIAASLLLGITLLYIVQRPRQVVSDVEAPE